MTDPIQIGPATLYQGDSLRLLDALRDMDVAAIVADPPYGIGYCHSGGGKGVSTSAGRNARMPLIGDDAPFAPGPWLPWPVVLLWGANHYAQRIPAGGSWLAWDKSMGRGPRDSFSDGEFAWTSRGGLKRNVLRVLWKGVACRKAGEFNGRRWHPTQKPVALMVECLRLLDLPDDALVCDPYMGSGTTGVACIREGLRFVGVEWAPRYFGIATRRIAEAVAAGRTDPLLARASSSV